MEVILMERIEKLGQMGDVVKVKPGYARNFLLPQKKAMRATEDNRKFFEQQRAQLEATNLQRRGEAEDVAGRMEGQWVVLVRQAGEAGQLYGSVNARDVAEALTEAGFTVTRRQVELAHPIKTIGIFPVHVRLHPEVTVTITCNVARSLDEAEIQQKTGRALIGEEEEEGGEAAEAPAEAGAEAATEEIPGMGEQPELEEPPRDEAPEANAAQAESATETPAE